MTALLPLGSDWAQSGAFTVIVLPDWENVPFQPLPMVTPLGTVNVIDHWLIAAPLFFTVISPWKPPGQVLGSLTVAAQVPVPPLVVVTGLVVVVVVVVTGLVVVVVVVVTG